MTERPELGEALRDALPKFDAPASLESFARNQAGTVGVSRRDTRGWPMKFAQVAAMLIIGVGIGWGAATLRTSSSRNARDVQIASTIVDSHVRSLLPGHLTDVLSTDRHTVKPWFTGKTDIAPPVNDLSASGFPLYGGRLDYVAGRSAAAIVYQRRAHVINLFVLRTSPGEPPAKSFSIRGYSVLHWIIGDLSYWAVTDAAPNELEDFRRAYLSIPPAAVQR